MRFPSPSSVLKIPILRKTVKSGVKHELASDQKETGKRMVWAKLCGGWHKLPPFSST